VLKVFVEREEISEQIELLPIEVQNVPEPLLEDLFHADWLEYDSQSNLHDI